MAHLEVESRFSYRGDEAVQDFYTAAARLSLFSDNSKLAMALLPQVKPPQGSPPQVSRPAQASAPAVAAPSPESATPRPGEGFLHRFFRRLFGH